MSGPCQAQGITTAQQWAGHFNQPSANKNTHACGFDLSPTVNGLAAYFMVNIAARALIPADSFGQNDELVVATWPQMENPTPLPIQAFFYLPGGLAGAQYDQKDYYTQAGTVIPIIAMTLPATAANDATFVYREADQAVGGTEQPPPAETEDFARYAAAGGMHVDAGSTFDTGVLSITPNNTNGASILGPNGDFPAFASSLVGASFVRGGYIRISLNRERSSVSLDVSTKGQVRFNAYSADGLLLDSRTSISFQRETVTLKSPDARKIKYLQLDPAANSYYYLAVSNFHLY